MVEEIRRRRGWPDKCGGAPGGHPRHGRVVLQEEGQASSQGG